MNSIKNTSVLSVLKQIIAARQEVPNTPPNALLEGINYPVISDIVKDIPTPAIVYDMDRITGVVNQVREVLKNIPNLQLSFAIKANRCPTILKHLAQLGLGADIASITELDAAINAGLSPIHATAAGFSVADFQRLADCGIIPDINSLSQLELWCQYLHASRQIGLRLPYSSSDTISNKSSRFGVDPWDSKLHNLIKTYNLEVVSLHFHSGEPKSADVIDRMFDVIVRCLEIFPNIETINFGGGWAYLFYLQRNELQQACNLLGDKLVKLNQYRQQPLKIILEPGMLLTMMAGFLVTEVLAVDELSSGVYNAVLNTSAYNLMPWTPHWILGSIPNRSGTLLSYNFVGCTCYEEDYFLQNYVMPPLEVGDRIIFAAAGAYTSSLAGCLHGLPIPQEWVIDHGGLFPINPTHSSVV